MPRISAKAVKRVRTTLAQQSDLDWVGMTQMIATVQCKHNTLGIIAQQHGSRSWSVFAVETPGRNVEAVLANHAHKVVGAYATLNQAVAAAEAFVKKWRTRHKQTKAGRCACGEISA